MTTPPSGQQPNEGDPSSQPSWDPTSSQPPQFGQPQPGQPQPGQPQPGQPQPGQPQYGQPDQNQQYGQPGQPQYGQPQYGQPDQSQQYWPPQPGQPQSGQPQSGQPQYGQPDQSQQYGQPQYGQPDQSQQFAQQPYGQQAVPGQYGYSAPGSSAQSGQAKKANKTPWIIGAAIVAVLAVVGGIFAFGGGGGDDKKTATTQSSISGSTAATNATSSASASTSTTSSAGAAGNTTTPDGVVLAYLNALAAGHADEALGYGNAVGSKTFLTNDALAAQQAKAKISDVNITAKSTYQSESHITAHYLFGTQTVNGSYALSLVGGKWKLDDTTVDISVSNVDGLPSLTLFGTKVPTDTSKVTVFPGPLVWGSANKTFTVKDAQADRFATYPSAYGYASLSADLSPAGAKALATAIDAKFAACAKIKTADADGCPNKVFDYEAVTNSFTWTLNGRPSTILKYRVGYSDATQVSLSGNITMVAKYKAKDFNNKVTSKSYTDHIFVYGTADMSKSKISVDLT